MMNNGRVLGGFRFAGRLVNERTGVRVYVVLSMFKMI